MVHLKMNLKEKLLTRFKVIFLFFDNRNLRWLVGTKHVPESKTLPRIQKHVPESKNTSQNPKHVPEFKNTFQNRDLGCVLDSGKSFWIWILGSVLDSGMCFWILGSFLDSGKCFWILERVLDSGKCFWILGSVLESGKCFVLMSHRRNQVSADL